jgi:hypothetical protein
MTAILTTLMRGLLGVVATIVLVAAVWSVYANRAPLITTAQFVIGVFTPHEEPATAPAADTSAAARPGEAAPAPATTPGSTQ